PDGLVESDKAYQNIAFVSIFNESKNLANIPVELVEERTLPVAISINPEAERWNPLFRERNRWLHRVYDAMEVAANVVREFNDPPDKAKAQEKIEEGLKALEADLKNLNEELGHLKGEFAKLPAESQADLTQGEQHLQDLQSLLKKLESHKTKL